MPTEVRSPISSRRSDQLGPGNPQPLSPGARSMPGGRASSDRGRYPDSAQEGEQPEQPHEQHVRVETHLHPPAEEPEQEARGDSLGYFRRLGDALLNRPRPRSTGYTFRNFPRD